MVTPTRFARLFLPSILATIIVFYLLRPYVKIATSSTIPAFRYNGEGRGKGNSTHSDPLSLEHLDQVDSTMSIDEDMATQPIDEPLPRLDFALYSDMDPAHLEQFETDGIVFGTLFCSRTRNLRDPYFASTQQLIWRILWTDYASKHPIVIFVCPFVSEEFRSIFRGQGAWVEELELFDVKAREGLYFARWADQYSKLNLWAKTQFKRIAYLDSDAFPVKNIDDVFNLVQPQKCLPDLLEPEDKLILAEHDDKFCEYVFAGVVLPTVFMDRGRGVNGGFFIIEPNELLHKRLIKNALRTEEYNQQTMEQSFLNSKLAFSYDSAFPAQEIPEIYNFATSSILDLLAPASRDLFQAEEETAPLRSSDISFPLLTNSIFNVKNASLPVDSIRVLHDKLWLPFSPINNNPIAPEWNQIWSIDWMNMCRTYDNVLFPHMRKIGRTLSYFEKLAVWEDLRAFANSTKM